MTFSRESVNGIHISGGAVVEAVVVAARFVPPKRLACYRWMLNWTNSMIHVIFQHNYCQNCLDQISGWTLVHSETPPADGTEKGTL